MSIPEWHELAKILFIGFTGGIAVLMLFVKYAEWTYKRKHKKIKKTKQKNLIKIVYDIGDTSKMTLFEIKQLRGNMQLELEKAILKGVR